MKSQIKSLPTSLIEPLETGRITSRAWLITGMLIIFQMINFADKAVLGLVAEPAMRELGMSSSQFGFIGSSFFFLFLFVIFIFGVGFLGGKKQKKWVLLVLGIAGGVLQFSMLKGGGGNSPSGYTHYFRGCRRASNPYHFAAYPWMVCTQGAWF